MKIIFALLLIFSLSHSAFAESPVLNSFETDYCTNYAEGTFEEPDLWKHCCLIHDMFFWAGGSKKDRDLADLDLKKCIEATGADHQARLIYLAVRAGSYSPIKYPKKMWNNGWNDHRSPRPLSQDDIILIEQEILNGHDYIRAEIKDYFLNTLKSRSY